MPNKYTLTKKQVAEYLIEIANAAIDEILTENVREVKILETNFIYFLNTLKDKTPTDCNQLKQLIVDRIDEVIKFIYEEVGKGKVGWWYFDSNEKGVINKIPKEILNEGHFDPSDLVVMFEILPNNENICIHYDFLYMTNEEIKAYLETNFAS